MSDMEIRCIRGLLTVASCNKELLTLSIETIDAVNPKRFIPFDFRVEV